MSNKQPIVDRISEDVQTLQIGRSYTSSAGGYPQASMLRETGVASFERVRIDGYGLCRTVVEIELDEENVVQTVRYAESAVDPSAEGETPILEYAGAIEEVGVVELARSAVEIRRTVSMLMVHEAAKSAAAQETA